MKTLLNDRLLHSNVTKIRKQHQDEAYWKKNTRKIKKIMLEKTAEKVVDIDDEEANKLINQVRKETMSPLQNFTIFKTSEPPKNESPENGLSPENSLWCSETLDF